MDKKYEYFDVQNVMRSALVLKRKKPFSDWLEFVEAGSSVLDDFEPNVYLLPDYETIAEMENWLKRNFDLLFQEELNSWFTDEDVWPQKRTFRIFKEWFDYSLHTMIFDLEKGFIGKI